MVEISYLDFDKRGIGFRTLTSPMGKAASIAYILIETAKMNGLDPQAWLTEVLHRVPEHPGNRIDELPPHFHRSRPLCRGISPLLAPPSRRARSSVVGARYGSDGSSSARSSSTSRHSRGRRARASSRTMRSCLPSISAL